MSYFIQYYFIIINTRDKINAIYIIRNEPFTILCNLYTTHNTSIGVKKTCPKFLPRPGIEPVSAPLRGESAARYTAGRMVGYYNS